MATAKKTTTKSAAKKPASKATTKSTAKKPVAKKTTKPAAKKVASKPVTEKKVETRVEKKKSMPDIYNTNVSILLAMAIEAMILLLGYLIIMSAA